MKQPILKIQKSRRPDDCPSRKIKILDFSGVIKAFEKSGALVRNDRGRMMLFGRRIPYKSQKPYYGNSLPRARRICQKWPQRENKYTAYRRRCMDKGLCPHCGKSAWPYYECEERRFYKRVCSVLSALAKTGEIIRTSDGAFKHNPLYQKRIISPA